MQRDDWEAHSSRRWAALPMTMLEADRLSSTSAPARAAPVEGGSATQMSSQISTWKVKGQAPTDSNRRSAPNGAVWPPTAMSRPDRPAPEVNQRRS